jgi:hypothetical protein
MSATATIQSPPEGFLQARSISPTGAAWLSMSLTRYLLNVLEDYDRALLSDGEMREQLSENTSLLMHHCEPPVEDLWDGLREIRDGVADLERGVISQAELVLVVQRVVRQVNRTLIPLAGNHLRK